MNKHLTRSDYLFALLFLFMLVSVVGAFFFGMVTGEKKATAKYESMLAGLSVDTGDPGAYTQQHLVSFYHTIYVPFTEFAKKWFESKDEIELGADPSAAFKELARLAGEKYDAIANLNLPGSSPLLKESHRNYATSLQRFRECLEQFQKAAGPKDGPDLIKQLEASGTFAEARRLALLAQQNFYDAMSLWYKAQHPEFNPIDFAAHPELAPDSWKQFNLLAKNAYIAGLMAADGIFQPYTPQDLAARVDEFIDSGQSAKLNLHTIRQIGDLLSGANAVRPGDYVKVKNSRYGREPLPLLPFF